MGWRQQTRAAIREYPELRRRERELKAGSVTVRYGGRIGGRASGTPRETEDLSLRQLPREEQKKLDAVRAAVQTTRRYRNGDLRLRLIELVYWSGTHTLAGAALKIHVSQATAKSWHNGFIELVDAYRRVL